MTEFRRRPLNLQDSPEHRAIPVDTFQVDDSDPDILTLTGYASTFQPYEMYGGPANGQGWIEQIDRGAFDRTLKEGPDLHLLINHEGLPLARTKSGDLDLSVDDHGLKVVARLHRSDPDVQRLEPKMRKRPDQARALMDEMSFAFRVKGQEWSETPEFKDDPQALRKITEVSLHKGDVSVVNWGANPTTSAELHSVADALKVIADCDARELVEARAEDDVLRRAKAKLANIGILDTKGAAGAGKATAIDFARGVAESFGVGHLLRPAAEEGRSYTEADLSTMIASLDAVLDEAFGLVTNVDEKSLPEPVAQALDLMRGARTIVGEIMEAAGLFDPDAQTGERMSVDELEKRESVSDHAWNFPQSAYTPEQWRHACLIDTGKGDMDAKSRYKEPVREPDGTLNKNGVHAAAGRLDQVDGISDEQRTLAAKKLIALYRDQLKEDPPAHLLELAHERAAEVDLSTAIEELMDVARGLKVIIEEFNKRDESRDDDMEECDSDSGDDEEESLDADGGDMEEDSARGMSLSEARSLETNLSLADLSELD